MPPFFITMIIGLTGGIGAGKSAVADLMARRGAAVIDTDVIAREVVEPPSALLGKIRDEFGAEVIAADGRLDREAVARIVFADDAKRKRLNDITHPEILKRVLSRIGAYPPSAMVVVVVPLLFESGFESNCDATVSVVAPREVRLRRVVERDGRHEDDVRSRMDAQLPDEEYRKRATYVVVNDGDRSRLESEVDRVWSQLAARHA
jgi:dephospho-CoA kinase